MNALGESIFGVRSLEGKTIIQILLVGALLGVGGFFISPALGYVLWFITIITALSMTTGAVGDMHGFNMSPYVRTQEEKIQKH